MYCFDPSHRILKNLSYFETFFFFGCQTEFI